MNLRKHANVLAPLAGWSAVAFWLLLCVRWFDDGALWRPRALTAISPLALVLLLIASAAVWLRRRWRSLVGTCARPDARVVLLVCVLAFLFRLPMAWHGAAGYVTPDGALSGVVSVHVRDGIDHHVFLPQLPYSGSLKSHLTALIALAIDAPRAFALSSLLFYALFAAGVCHLSRILDGTETPYHVLAAGLYVAFAPPFVTRYSLSNDGNYVEVLAFGTWVLVLACVYCHDEANRPLRALAAGVLLGLALWSHILALYYVVTFGIVLVVRGLRAWRSALSWAFGMFLGYFPGVLWNAGHDWRSLSYVLGHEQVGELSQGPNLIGRFILVLREQLPILVGYEPTEPAWLDWLRWTFVWLALISVGLALALACVRAARGSIGDRVLIAFVMVNLGVCVYALPHVPGNPRYVLFLIAPFAVVLGRTFRSRYARAWMIALIFAGALGSWALAPAAFERNRARRELATGLEDLGVGFCYTDFSLAEIINFVSEERLVCTAKLGPTTTEYFFEHRAAVENAPAAAFVPINLAAAAKLERRLGRLGVRFERADLSWPVLFRLSRKVDPQELFPHRSFAWR